MHHSLLKRLQSANEQLEQEVSFANIAAPLIQHCILSEDEYEEVLALQSERQRCRAVMHHLAGKADSAYYTFLEILRVDYPWIVDEIVRVGAGGDVVDGAPLPRPKPVILSGNPSEQSKEEHSSLGKSSSRRSLLNLEEPSPKRCSRDVVESIQVEKKSNTKRKERSRSNEKSISSRRKSNLKLDESYSKRRSLGADENWQLGFEGKVPKASGNSKDVENNVAVGRRANDSLIPVAVGDADTTTPVQNTVNQEKLAQAVSDEMMSVTKKNYRMCTRWTSLAHALGLSSCVDKIRFKVMLHSEDLNMCVVYLLREWVGELPKMATLGNLMTALRKEGFNDVADELENQFVT